MAKTNPADVIDSYRRRQKRRPAFTFADALKVLLVLIFLAALVYALLTGGSAFPVLIELKTNTPTHTPSITPTPTQTATATLTFTLTPDPKVQCNCPEPEVLIVTATLSATATPTTQTTETIVKVFTRTPTHTPTGTPSPSPTSTPTQIVYTVQSGDTLGGIALRFGVTIESIQSLNNLDSNLIYIGQVLQIPNP